MLTLCVLTLLPLASLASLASVAASTESVLSHNDAATRVTARSTQQVTVTPTQMASMQQFISTAVSWCSS